MTWLLKRRDQIESKSRITMKYCIAVVHWTELRSDAERPYLALPPHLSQARVLSDLDYLVQTLNVALLSSEDQESWGAPEETDRE